MFEFAVMILIASPCTKMNSQIMLGWMLDFLTLGGEMILTAENYVWA